MNKTPNSLSLSLSLKWKELKANTPKTQMKPRLKIEPRTHTNSMEKCVEFIRMNTKKEFDAIRRNSRTSPKTPNKSKSNQQRLFIE
jgi:hypothetical protein